MKRSVLLVLIGILFGLTMTKAEIISWYRIQEMFRFQSFHMYGIIGSAVLIGIAFVALSKKMGWKAMGETNFQLSKYHKPFTRYWAGGIIFGLGWALVGACPGPMYVLLGNGYTVVLVVIAGAFIGTLAYGFLKPRLPH